MFTTRPVLQGSFGMVASTHYLGSAVGMAVLEAGGNAVDAVVATGFTLQVVEPHLNGPGGDLPLLLQLAGERADRAVRAGSGAGRRPTRRRSPPRGLSSVPGAGVAAAAVPGVHQRLADPAPRPRHHGRCASCSRYAVHYAEDGVPGAAADPRHHRRRRRAVRGPLADVGGDLPARRARHPAPGRPLRNPALAGTYRGCCDAAARPRAGRRGIDAALADLDRRLRRRGDRRVLPAAELDDGPARRHRRPADRRGPGPLAARPTSRRSAVDFRGWTVFKTGPWGQGPVLLQQLVLLDGIDLAAGHRRLRAHRRRGGQARLRRPRGLVRRQTRTCPLDALLSTGVRARTARS